MLIINTSKVEGPALHNIPRHTRTLVTAEVSRNTNIQPVRLSIIDCLGHDGHEKQALEINVVLIAQRSYQTAFLGLSEWLK